MERQRAEIMEVLHTREAAIDAREAKACEREAALQKLEQQGKEHVKKDAEELQHQLTSCTHTELQCQQQCYVDEKQKAAETLVATIEEREVRLKLREKTVENRDMSLTDREGNSSILSDRWERQDGIASSGADLHDQRCGVLGGTGGKNSVQELFGVQHSGTQDSVSIFQKTHQYFTVLLLHSSLCWAERVMHVEFLYNLLDMLLTQLSLSTHQSILFFDLIMEHYLSLFPPCSHLDRFCHDFEKNGSCNQSLFSCNGCMQSSLALYVKAQAEIVQ
jgi:hypothetical protein